MTARWLLWLINDFPRRCRTPDSPRPKPTAPPPSTHSGTSMVYPCSCNWLSSPTPSRSPGSRCAYAAPSGWQTTRKAGRGPPFRSSCRPSSWPPRSSAWPFGAFSPTGSPPGGTWSGSPAIRRGLPSWSPSTPNSFDSSGTPARSNCRPSTCSPAGRRGRRGPVVGHPSRRSRAARRRRASASASGPGGATENRHPRLANTNRSPSTSAHSQSGSTIVTARCGCMSRCSSQ